MVTHDLTGLVKECEVIDTTTMAKLVSQESSVLSSDGLEGFVKTYEECLMQKQQEIEALKLQLETLGEVNIANSHYESTSYNFQRMIRLLIVFFSTITQEKAQLSAKVKAQADKEDYLQREVGSLRVALSRRTELTFESASPAKREADEAETEIGKRRKVPT